MKCTKTIVILAVTLAALASVITAAILFQEELQKAYSSCKEACLKVVKKKDEYEDFADV